MPRKTILKKCLRTINGWNVPEIYSINQKVIISYKICIPATKGQSIPDRVEASY